MTVKEINYISLSLFIGPFCLLGCAQQSHTFCQSETEECVSPLPPRLQTSNPSSSMEAPRELAPITKPLTKEQHTAPHSLFVRNTDQATQRAPKKVKIIENIRYQKKQTPPALMSKRISPKHMGDNKAIAARYTVQLGAYRLENSRLIDINRLPPKSRLFIFKMKNNLLGLSYGSFASKQEAKTQVDWLKMHGFTEYQFRKLPANAASF